MVRLSAFRNMDSRHPGRHDGLGGDEDIRASITLLCKALIQAS